MIYLWHDDIGWSEHELTDAAAIAERGIIIGYNAQIGGGAQIGDDAQIGGGAQIGDNAQPIIVYIIGSRHAVSYWGEDRIDIGCHHHSIKFWKEKADEIGTAENYTSEQIAEYKRYVDMIAEGYAGRES